jgi:hypothetical protein
VKGQTLVLNCFLFVLLLALSASIDFGSPSPAADEYRPIIEWSVHGLLFGICGLVFPTVYKNYFSALGSILLICVAEHIVLFGLYLLIGRGSPFYESLLVMFFMQFAPSVVIAILFYSGSRMLRKNCGKP